MIEIQAPHKDTIQDKNLKIFLAGSIEMGKAVDWQSQVVKALAGLDCTVYNPRRKDWDSSWVQSIDNPQFFEQVNWEADHIETADIVFFNFDPDTISPITLYELGTVLNSGRHPIVVCPKGYPHRGNVEIYCWRSADSVFETLDEGLKELILFVKIWNGFIKTS